MNIIGITLETMVFCMESTCKHYYEDNCLYINGHTKYTKGQEVENVIDCPMYKKGIHDAYRIK